MAIFLWVVHSQTGPYRERLLLRQVKSKESFALSLSRDQGQDPVTEKVFVVQRFAPAQGRVTGTTAEQETPFTDPFPGSSFQPFL